MSELSESEKRRILKERRQKKFSGGSASQRLNKIIGQVDDTSNTQPPVTQQPALNTAAAAAASSIEAPVSVVQNAPLSKTISQGKESSVEVELLKQLASMENSGDRSTPDLLSLLSSMKGPENAGVGSSSSAATAAPEPPADPALLKYHNYVVNRLRATTILRKWLFFLLPLTYLATHGGRTSFILLPESLNFLVDPSNFFMIFTSFETVATTIYYQKLRSIEEGHSINTLDNNSKIMKLLALIPENVVPVNDIKGKVTVVMRCIDILSLFLADLCFVVVLIGLLNLV